MTVARDRSAGPEAKPLRLFVAVDVPEHVKDNLRSATARFRDRIPGARWTNPDAWHVTVKFLGTTWPRVVEDVRATVEAAAADEEPFETALTELGAFPRPTMARVLWAGLADSDGRFATLAASLDRALEEHFDPGGRAFTPHLTLARLAPPRNLREFVPDLVGTNVASEKFVASALVLYRSHLSPAGARYEPLLVAPFGRDA
ncbi:MAG: RNA 2',3'-cyclic phosphodiesterase [Actinobacteria bacterium]|nr:MAG: RNA 2',3'-cyclic phosphodiesterase [Actinomycetota bacterium]